MSGIDRKIRRNFLKKKYKTNKIKDLFHEEYDTLEQKIRRNKNQNQKGK